MATYYCPVKHQRSTKPCDCTLTQRLNRCNALTSILRERPPMLVPEPAQVLRFKHQQRGG